MNIEYEATFIPVDKEDVRKRLRGVGAELIKEEFLQKRICFELPKGHEIKGAWLRVRDEGDKITMSLKIVDGDKIINQRETQLVVDNFSEAVSFLKMIGCKQKAYQETKRETWSLNGVCITIDEWPFLEPFVEVEGESEDQVRGAVKKIGFDYLKAKFCSVDVLYSEKYDFPPEHFNNNVKQLNFEMKNPFV